MKIEINIDEERLKDDVVTQIVRALYSQVKEEVFAAARAEVRASIRAKLKHETEEMLKTLVFPDGISFREYARGVLLKPAGYRDRARLLDVVDETVRDYCKQWWTEVFENHMPSIKEQLKQELLSKTLGSFIQVK